MLPKGKLLIIGGAEAKEDAEISNAANKIGFPRYEILREFLNLSNNKKIEIITTGSQVQDEVKKRYKKVFRDINYPNPGFIPIKERSEAKYKKYLTRVQEAGAVFFTGGDQFRLATILGGTELIDILKKRYYEDSNFLIAGTSAGAMIMSEVMIIDGGNEEALVDWDLKTSSGLGFLKNCIVDTHFIKRGRFGRLAHAVVLNSDQLGIGLGEDTALIIKNGYDAECRGSGMVVIIDGKDIEQTNVTHVNRESPVFVENLRIDILVKGCRFYINKRRLAKPAIKPLRHTKEKPHTL